MKRYEIVVHDENEMLAFAERLSHFLQAGDVLALEGDLGAGKTSFTKGIAKGLGIKRTVNSPTFTIIKEYHGKLPLYHMDVYRLEGSDEDLGFDEYFYGEGLTVKEDTSRNLRFIPAGERYEQLCEEFFNEHFSN